MAGIVYYANYLRYIERARSEIVEELGIDQRTMRDVGIVFAVTRVEADYLGSARLGDRVKVVTTHYASGAVRWVFDQTVELDGKPIFRAKVTAACMTVEGKPTRLPAEIRALKQS
jgi:acyl-CoA thioester hydrolase